MRLFLAVDLDKTVANAVAGWIERLVRALGPPRAAEIRFADAHQLHLTLQFLGSMEPQDADKLRKVLDRDWAHAPFDVTLGEAGTFPPRGHPRVLWLGLADGHAATVELAKTVHRRVRDAGFGHLVEDRPLSPHLTVGRVRQKARPGLGHALAAALTESPAPSGRWLVNHVTLYESLLSPRGSRYESRGRWPLGQR